MMDRDELIWGFMIQLGHNMWSESPLFGEPKPEDVDKYAQPFNRTDVKVWNEITEYYAKKGANLVLIDLGEGLQYPSHPELAVKGSWSPERMKEEIVRLKGLGLEPIPKLNFSACHDAWLKEYSRMVSTSTYYRVTRDLICETAELFSNPPLFHLGMDEENYGNQRSYDYAVIRSGDLWWSDLDRLFDACNSVGARPWVWSDVIWSHPEEFSARMPREVLQSNWYYGTGFEPDESGRYNRDLESFLELDELGFEQVPTGSNWERAHNMEQLAAFCDEHLSRENLAGFMMAPWCFTIPKEYYRLMDGAAHLSAAQKRVMGS